MTSGPAFNINIVIVIVNDLHFISLSLLLFNDVRRHISLAIALIIVAVSYFLLSNIADLTGVLVLRSLLDEIMFVLDAFGVFHMRDVVIVIGRGFFGTCIEALGAGVIMECV